MYPLLFFLVLMALRFYSFFGPENLVHVDFCQTSPLNYFRYSLERYIHPNAYIVSALGIPQADILGECGRNTAHAICIKAAANQELY